MTKQHTSEETLEKSLIVDEAHKMQKDYRMGD